MNFINTLENLKLYANCKISGYDVNEPLKKDNLVIHLAKKDDSIIDFFNNELFQKEYFNNFYKENIISDNNKKFFLGLSNHYSNIKKEVKFNLNTKNKMSSFKNNNLVIDLSPNYNLNKFKSSTSASKKLLLLIMDYIKLNINHKNFLIVINVDDNTLDLNDYINNKNTTPFGSLYNIINQDISLPKIDKNINFIIYSNNTFFKFPYDKDFIKDNKNTILLRMKDICNICLSKSSTKEEKGEENLSILQKLIRRKDNKSLNNEVSEKDLKQLENITKADEKANEVSERILSRIILTDDELNSNQKGIIARVVDKIRSLVGKEENTEKEIEIILDDLEKDKELMNDLEFLKDTVKIGKEKEIIDNLKKQQDEINLNDLKFKDIFNDMESVLTDKELDIDVINKEIKKVSQVKQFDDLYITQQYEKDMANILKSFNDDIDMPTFVTEITTEDTSNDLNKKNTMSIKMKDKNNKTHNIKIDVPKIIDGKYMIVNGSKKIIQKQLTLKPIVKTKPDVVQITTNYIKVFITRFGQKKTASLNLLKKIFTDIDLKKYKIKSNSYNFKFGNAVDKNSKYETSLEYVDISEYLLNFETEEVKFIFDQTELLKFIENDDLLSEIKYDNKKYFPVGYTLNKDKIILTNFKDKSIYYVNKSKKYELLSGSLSFIILDLLLINNKDSLKQEIDFNIKASQTLCYSRVEMNNKKVPVIILLSYELGLKNVLNRYNIDWKFSTKNESINVQDNKNKIKFKDGYLIYDVSKIRNSILLSGLNIMDTNNINFSDMENKEPYLDLFYDLFKSRNAVKGFHNSLTLMVDPITKEVLNDLGLPDNIYDLMLYANTMLEDISYKHENDMSLYRVRGAEQINACMYQLLANSFKNYKDTSNARNPVKMSLPQDALTKKLLELPTVDEFSELNPSLEIEKMNAVTFKGAVGKNLDDSYTKEIRSFDKSMEGILAMNTPDSDKIGVVRELTYNTAITNTRGYLNIEKELNGNTDLYSPAELMNVFSTTHADPPRLGMVVTQQKHVVATKKQDPLLVGSGIEKAFPYVLSDTFAVKAKDNGKIKNIDNKNNLVFLEYSDGTEDVISLDTNQVKNSNGGFYVSQRLDLLYKEGQRFKKGDIIAKNSAFFTGNKKEDISYSFGKLAKIALASGDFTYEDSSIITEKLSKDMSTKVTMKEELILDVNANIDYLVQEGQKIKTGDPLCIFENSFEDQSINDLLSKIGDELGQEIAQLTKNTKKSHYTGQIVKINMYYNRDIEEFSPSIQKILKNYIKKYNEKSRVIKNNKNLRDTMNIYLPPIEKQEGGKIKGKDVNGILIEIYTEYDDVLSVGDKISFYTSLKTIICDVIRNGEEPFSEYHKDENIDAILSPLSIVSRMTSDIYFSMFSNKALIELKKQIKDTFENKK